MVHGQKQQHMYYWKSLIITFMSKWFLQHILCHWKRYICLSLSLLVLAYIWRSFHNNTRMTFFGKENEFVDNYFQPILRSFMYNEDRESPNIEKKTILLFQDQFEFNSSFWNNQLIDIHEDRCPKRCVVTGNLSEYKSADAIVFYLCNVKGKSHLQQLFPERIASQPWVVLSFEGPLRATKTMFNLSEMNGIFNRTMNYKSNSDIIVPHGFIVKKDEVSYLPRQWTMPVLDYAPVKKRKSKMAVAFISNCNVESGRMEYIKDLQKHVNVDVYGKCGNMKCGSRKLVRSGYNVTTDKCFHMASKKYLFYLSFENAICKDYVSEKLYNILYYPIIPVVLGGADYENRLPPGSYINALDYTPKDLATLMKTIYNSDAMQRSFFQWRVKYQPSTMGGDRTMCHLCIRLHDPTFYEHSVIEDFPQWFVKDSNCNRRWTSKGITNF